MNTRSKSSGGIGAAVAAICIVIYLFALIQAAARVYLSIEDSKITAENEFSRIASTALSAGLQGFMDQQFVETMNNALLSSDYIEALIISWAGGEYSFEKQRGYAIKIENNSPRFIHRLSFSNKSFYRPLPIHDLRNANINAVASAFNFNEIIKILKETLLLILAGFVIAFFTMLLQMLIGKPDGKPEPVPAMKTQPEQKLRETSKVSVSSSERKETPIIAPVTESLSVGEEPKGLYSPRSNIGWEEYIEERLDSELHRCASTEKDLTLILMDFADITNDLMYRQAAEESISFFSSRDMLFEYGKSGILVILPGVDLDTGILKSEKFYQRVSEKFPSNNRKKSSLFIGLSSRSGRLLNADRLIVETKEALIKAKNDHDTSIIAFKSDPEKYRAFIASQN